jgi:hypothetical protein
MSNTWADWGNPFAIALTVGLSCGTACSPLVNIFLTIYTMGRCHSLQQGVRTFGLFWTGKTVAVGILAFLSAVLGRAIIGQSGRIVCFDPRLVLDGFLILTGCYLLAEIIRGKGKGRACGDCGGACRSGPAESIRDKGVLPLVIMGMAYGLTPCAPLMLLLLTVATLSPLEAVLIGLVFSIANSISPLLLLTVLAGLISQRIQWEIPQLMRVFQMTTFGLLIILGVFSLLGHLSN